MKIYGARHVLPVVSPPQRDAAVAVEDGRIAAVGSRADVLRELSRAEVDHDLGEAVILPGLINVHTHLELSWAGAAALPRGDYIEWLRALLGARESIDTTAAAAAAEQAIRDLVRRGTVAVGDVGNRTWIVPIVARSPLRGVFFHELYGMDPATAEADLRTAAAELEVLAVDPDLRQAEGRLRVALTPHAPHTTSAPMLRALAGRAAATADPLSVHVAESLPEGSLLADGSGPLAALYRERGFVPPGWTPPGRSPVEHLRRCGVLTRRTIAVHCVHLDHQDHSTLQSCRVTVAACPRSNAALGVGTAAIPELMRQGIPVALGTDSLASAPDLDLFAEMAALRVDHPTLSPAAVARMATWNGARALGLGRELGSIEAGKLAALIVVPLDAPSDPPLELLCSTPKVVHRLEDAPGALGEPSS